MFVLFRRHPLVFILALALALRLGFAIALDGHVQDMGRQFLIEGDANGYWTLGERIASGQTYAIHEPPRSVLRMPGFPAFLAFCMRIGGTGTMPARLGLTLVGVLVVWLVYLLGCTLFDRRVGLAASTYSAVAPVHVGFCSVLLSETLFAATLLVSLLTMARLFVARDNGKAVVLWSCLTGLAIAAAVYVRPAWILIAPLFAAILLVTSRGSLGRSVMAGVLVVSSMMLALLPWAVRNHHVCGHYVFTTLWSGPSLYDGLSPNATGASDMRFFDQERVFDRMSEYEVNRHYNQRGWKFARQNPGRAAELGLIKLSRFWMPWPNAEQFDDVSIRAGVLVFFVPLILTAIVGVFRFRRYLPGLLLTAGPMLYLSLLHLIFVGSVRYRLPAEYPLSVLSAAAIWGSGSRQPRSPS